MKEVRLIDIYESIRNDKPKIREEGLQQLLKILENTSNNAVLQDNEYHLLLENVFKGVVEEKFLLARKSSRSTSHLRCLQLFASVVRAAVSAGYQTFRAKLVKAISSHVVQVLPDGSDLCEAIRLDYTKAFRKLWSYSPHIDHLRKSEWTSLVNFCMDSISKGMLSSLDAFAKTNEKIDLNPSNIANLLAGQPTASLPRLRADYIELIYCLEEFVCWPNALLDETSDSILKFSLSFLAMYGSESNAHGSVVAILNKVLGLLQYNNIALVHNVILGLLDVLLNLWATHSSKLAEELIVLCMRVLPFFARECGENPDMRDHLALFLEKVHEDSGYKSERNMLQFDSIPVQFVTFFPASPVDPDSPCILPSEIRMLPCAKEPLLLFLNIYIAAFLTSTVSFKADGSKRLSDAEKAKSRISFGHIYQGCLITRVSTSGHANYSRATQLPTPFSLTTLHIRAYTSSYSAVI